ncbi:MAG: hypothetical protein FJ291_10320 [Planctomycetes bacterium]|nr:hypothetical protein [Planctomycetota bacterium]
MRKRIVRTAIIVAVGHLLGFTVYGLFWWRGGSVSKAEARRLVERYNSVVSEAYRRADVGLIDPVVGPNTVAGRRLTGLIGVRLDMGLTLDAELLELAVIGVAREGDELHVRTTERWRYRDRRIGSGEQVGEESSDACELLYLFRKFGKAWLVAETRFTSPPQVGRKTIPWAAGRKALHGFAPSAKAPEEKAR